MPLFFVVILSQVATEKDFLDAINKVIKAYAKFSSTPRYMTYNWTTDVFILLSFLYRDMISF